MSTLCLYALQDFRLDVFLKERCDLGVEVGAEGAEETGVAIRGDAALCGFVDK